MEDRKKKHDGLATGTGFSTRLIWCVNLFQKRPTTSEICDWDSDCSGFARRGSVLGKGVEIAANRKFTILAFDMSTD